MHISNQQPNATPHHISNWSDTCYTLLNTSAAKAEVPPLKSGNKDHTQGNLPSKPKKVCLTLSPLSSSLSLFQHGHHRGMQWSLKTQCTETGPTACTSGAWSPWILPASPCSLLWISQALHLPMLGWRQTVWHACHAYQFIRDVFNELIVVNKFKVKTDKIL